ncbi:MAG TPA: hypothetical protein VK625_17930, partial [Flavitalea sp.]|nr:hypothetical protein [Flavitalea sp.]
MKYQFVSALLSITTFFCVPGCRPQKQIVESVKTPSAEANITNKYSSFKPGQPWYDDKGEVINAHGGGVLYANNKYYLFGEKRGRSRQEGVNVYSSQDLYNWKFEKLALAPSDTDSTSDIARGCLMERPKVIYNKKT